MHKTFAAMIFLGIFATLAMNSLRTAVADDPPQDYRLLYEQKCDKPEAMKDFVFTDPKAWRLGKDSKGHAALELFAKSDYKPKNRSPLNIAMIRTQRFGDFRLDAEIASTKKPYPHQDMCLYFGIQSPEEFYYAHLGFIQDPVSHRITIVNRAPRAVLPTEGNKGVKWEQNVWHKIRLERKTGDGSIKVFFDDMDKPVQTANDKTFGVGYVGVGSFDDVGMVRNIKIYGVSSEKGDADFFKPAK
jgi:hypothetical protein